MVAKVRTLRADEVEARVSRSKDGKVDVLLYKTARADMNVLDECFGPDNWRNSYREVKGNLFCEISIRCGDEWISKEDCGIESREDDGNERKGEASDAFKRAGFRWGIGRELYTAPKITINAGVDANGKTKAVYPDVKEIEYKNGCISKLVIGDAYGKTYFTWPTGTVPKDDAVISEVKRTPIPLLIEQILSLCGNNKKWLEESCQLVYKKDLKDMTYDELSDCKVRLAKKQEKKNESK